MKKITDFLKTDTPVSELQIALGVIKEFKSHETELEWMHSPFIAWQKLEQLEEHLEHLVNNEPLDPDTIEYMNASEEDFE